MFFLIIICKFELFLTHTHTQGACNLSNQKNEPSVLLLSLGFEKAKVCFWATFDGRIYFPVFFFSGVRASGSGLVQGP